MDRVLFSIEVTETLKNRSYWAQREWVTGNADAIRKADILLVPWEKFRDGEPALFPQGTSDFFKSLSKELTGIKTVVIAIDHQHFKEIALHANERRLPTLLVSAVVVPLLVNILSNHVDKLVFESSTTTPPIVEIALVVEGPQGRCVNVKYKGPATDLVKTIEQQVHKCFPPEGTKPAEQTKVGSKRRQPKK